MDISTFKSTIIFLLVILPSTQTTGLSSSNHSRNIMRFEGLQPFKPKEYQILEGNFERGRKLAPFQLCTSCKCCASSGDPTTCISMPCCYGIDCDLPNKPYGVCAFVPKMCNCSACATTP